MQKSALCSILFCSGSMVKQKVARDLGLSIGDIAFSGSHRLAAAMGIDGVIEAVMVPELSAEEYDLIDGANDDDDLLAAFIEISEDRDDMGADDDDR